MQRLGGLGLLVLCIASIALPLTQNDALQAVRDFEKDQGLELTYEGNYKGMEGPLVGSPPRLHEVSYIGDSDRYYSVADEGYVVSVTRYDLSASTHPALQLPVPLTQPQALAVAEQYAITHYPGFTSVNWRLNQESNLDGQLECQWEEQLPNGCLTCREVGVTVELSSGNVLFWHRLDASAPSAANTPPALDESAARAVLDQRFPGLCGVQPQRAAELRWDYGNNKLVWAYLMPSNEDGVVASLVDAQTGADVLTAFSSHKSGRDPHLVWLEREAALRDAVRWLPGGWVTVSFLLLSTVLLVALLLWRRRKPS